MQSSSLCRPSRVGALGMLCAVVLIFSATATPAQLTRGAILGTVSDTTNAMISGVEVKIRNLATGIERETTTNDAGVYRFAAIESGSYSVDFKMQGFVDRRVASVNVVASQEVVINQIMAISALPLEVNVTTTAGIELAKTNPTISRTLDGRMVESLAITPDTRDVTRLAILAPTVVRATGSNEFAANGQRARNSNFLIDGVDNNDPTITKPSVRLIPEAISEFQVQSTAYSAEFGHNSGAQVQSITRSGTNRFHGEGWDYYRGNWMEPLALTNKRAGITSTPRFVQNQGGGSLGGPIMRDRTFFFGLFEVNRFRQAPDARNATAASIPTPAGYAALQSAPLGPQQTPESRQAMLQALSFLPGIQSQVTKYDCPNQVCPKQNVNGVPIEIGTMTLPVANPYDLWYSVGRIDHRLTNRDNLTYRYTLDHRYRPDFVSNLQFGPKWSGAEADFNQNHAFSHTRVFTPRFVNEFRASYVRGNLAFPERDPNSSTVIINSLFTIGGLKNFPQSRISNTYQVQDVASYTLGKHALKFGFDIRRNELFNRTGENSKGTWTFSNLQDFMNNQAFSLDQAVNEASFDAWQTSHNYFFQDDWKLTKHLTVNLGMRYEYSTVPLGYFGAATDEIAAAGVARPAQPDTNNWAPRVGFAYSPSATGGLLGKVFGNGDSSIRGGFGMAYDVVFYNILIATANNYPRIVLSTTNQPATINLYPTLAPKIASVPPFDPLATFANTTSNIQSPTTNFWSLSVQRQFHRNYILEVGYSGNRSYHQLRQSQANPATLTAAQAAAVITSKSVNSIPSVQSRRLNPFWGSRTLIESTAKAEYHAGYIQFDKRMSNGLMVGGNYTYSANFSDNDEAFVATDLSDSSPQIPQNFFNLRNEWSRSAFDRPHRFAVHYTYEIPWFKGGFATNPIVSRVFAGWRMSGFTEFQSGQPFTIRTGADSAGIGTATPARPDYNPGGVLIVDPVTHDLRTFRIPLDGTGIVVTPLGTNGLPLGNSMPGGGTLGRNTFRGPGFNNWNWSLAKSFPVREGVGFEFRTDFINVWNHNNFKNPENRMNSAAFGTNTATLITDSRSMLFSGKLRF